MDSERLETGFEIIDGEHRVQIELVTALRQALSEGRTKEEVGEILGQLVSYTDVHFMAEQLLMRKTDYPGQPAHVMEHDRLIDQVRELQRLYQAGELALTLENADWLRRWLLKHIQSSDYALSRYLQRHYQPTI